MNVIRFIFPFLFVRNWFDGSWEFSRARLILFSVTILLCLVGLFIVSVLQAPVVYVAPSV